MADTGSTTPLLGVSVDRAPDDADSSPDVMAEVRSNLQRSLYRHPREAIKWLEHNGVKKLGSFKVQTTKVSNLLADPDAMLTFGAEEQDLDWEKLWRHRLGALKPPPSSGPEWSPVTEVDAFVVTVPHAADADDEGIVNPLLKRFMDNVCGIKVFGYPAVKGVLNFKWETWARRYLTVEMMTYFVWLVAFQAFILLLQDEDMDISLKKLVEEPRGIATVALECLSFAAMLPFIYIEIRSIQEYWGDWLNAWNALDVLAYANQTIILVMHLGRLQIDSNAFSVLCAAQVLLLWLRLQYFARVLQRSRQPFMETLRAVISEVKWFILLLLLLIVAFANSFNILFRKDQKDKEDFRTVWRSGVTMITAMMSGYEIETYSKSHNPFVAVVLLMLFVFSLPMVLLNCLIALMSDAAAKVNDLEGWQFMFSRAQIIDELETTVPNFIKRRNSHIWYPQYVHYLTINRDYENLKLLDVGGSPTIEEPDPEDEAKEDEENAKEGVTGGSSGSSREVQHQLDSLKSELGDAKEQIARLLQIQEAVARHVLPRNKVGTLLDSNGKHE